MHLLRRLWTSALHDRSVCAIADVTRLADAAKSAYRLNWADKIILSVGLNIKTTGIVKTVMWSKNKRKMKALGTRGRKEKNMRKNKMMRTASGLLVATLLTSSILFGTFSKYITKNSGSDTARVAKWGVVLQADGSLYGKNYGTENVPTTTNDAISLSVKSSTTDNVVAPGTKSDKGLSFSVNGIPEVSTKLTATIEAEDIYLKQGTYAVMVQAPTVTETSWKAGTYYTKTGDVYTMSTKATDTAPFYTKQDEVEVTEDYYPVVYKSVNGASTDGTETTGTLNTIADKYAKALSSDNNVTSTPAEGNVDKKVYSFNKKYDPNTNLGSLGLSNETLTWSWTFEDTTNKEKNNGADTILANLQAGTLKDAEVVKVGNDTIKAPVLHTDYNLETSFSIDITVEQVD